MPETFEENKKGGSRRLGCREFIQDSITCLRLGRIRTSYLPTLTLFESHAWVEAGKQKRSRKDHRSGERGVGTIPVSWR
jgi:hypothetical protein